MARRRSPGVFLAFQEHLGAFFLKSRAPGIEGSGGDDWTFQTVALIKDLGVDQADCFDVMAEWNATCVPPWQPDEFRDIISHGYKYGKNPQGIAHPKADFSEVTDETINGNTRKKSHLHFELFDQLTPDVQSPALVDGLLDPNALSVLFGPSNSGKTFCGIDLAFHIAAGRRWHERDVQQGAAVYVACEGSRAIRRRLLALRTYYGFI